MTSVCLWDLMLLGSSSTPTLVCLCSGSSDGTFTGKVELLPGNASAPARWHWRSAPSPPPEWGRGLHPPPPAEPAMAPTDTNMHMEDGRVGAWSGQKDVRQKDEHTQRWTYPVR